MPHLTLHAAETDLTGREEKLIASLTDAITTVYGDWARPIAVVHLVGVPAGRWGIGGVTAETPAPTITFGIKEEAFTRPGAVERLAKEVTGAVATVLGSHLHDKITINFIGTLPGRTATGGSLS
ncbi:4-oxalocrotonate tautomerase family protein [Actinoplanes sp. GCM10030250]|uniref:tautomerase family protein n=1 Tax=Actinoplanes sp. GCM10030250 TaxID=3273376 RepID=UPI003608EC1B